jgi:polygalacturonase
MKELLNKYEDMKSQPSNSIAHLLLTLLFALLANMSYSQPVKINIKSFGAKGDGKTNDQAAFKKAELYFQKRGGYGTLYIPKGIYRVGKQNHDGSNSFLKGEDVIHLSNLKNLSILGEKGSVIKYIDGLYFGSFDTSTRKKLTHTTYFTNYANLATVGHCFYLSACDNIKIQNLELDGNNTKLVLGGIFGDVGIQAPHYGVFIDNSKDVTLINLNVHHFALDGISIANKTPDGHNTPNQKISIISCSFRFNGRQGLSWIGGTGLTVTNTHFDSTGKVAISTPPGAGVDIEAEVGVVSNGYFKNCTFNNNFGCGMVADNGDSRAMNFENCEFTGTSTWSAWVKKPAFTFQGCRFYGSFVHGFNAETTQDATKFSNCLFTDVKDGKEMFGRFLLESNSAKRMSLVNCTFTSIVKKNVWIEGSSNWKPEERYQITATKFIINNTNIPDGDWVAVIRAAALKNNTYQFAASAKTKHYWVNECCDNRNTDLGGNKLIFK